MFRLKNRFFEESGVGDGAGGAAPPAGDNSAPENPPASTSWTDVVPEEYREMGLIKDSKDAAAFFKRVKDLDSYRGNSVRLPSENASDDERAEIRDKLLSHFGEEIMLRPNLEGEQAKEFYQQLGMPEEASGYTVPQVEGVNVPEDREIALRQSAHKHGLTDKQFQGFLNDMMAVDKGAMSEAQEAMQKEYTALKTDWGMAYEDRARSVRKFLEAKLPTLNADLLPASAMKELWPLAQAAFAGEPQLGGEGSVRNAMSPAEATSQIGELRRNKDFMKAYMNQGDPGHQAAKDKMRKLYIMQSGAEEEKSDYTVFGVG